MNNALFLTHPYVTMLGLDLRVCEKRESGERVRVFHGDFVGP